MDRVAQAFEVIGAVVLLGGFFICCGFAVRSTADARIIVSIRTILTSHPVRRMPGAKRPPYAATLSTGSAGIHDYAVPWRGEPRHPRLGAGLGAVRAAEGARRARRTWCTSCSTTSGFAGAELLRRADRHPEHRPDRRARACGTTQWHTTALCSPTRSCLLTGRNHTTNGMACITEARDRLPERQRPHPAGVRDARRGAGRARLQHGHGRQVAPDRRGRDEPGVHQGATGRWAAGSSGSTASSARRPTSGIRTWSTTTTRWSSPTRPRTATTSAST